MSTLDGNLHVKGHLSAGSQSVAAGSVDNGSISGDAGIERTKLEQEQLAIFPVKLTDLRVWDAYQTVLPNPSANDDLGMYGGTFATDSPQIKTYDVKAAGALTFYARFELIIPAEYDAAETAQLCITAGMETTVADNSCTLDVQAYETDDEGGIGADICATAAQSINSLTKAEKTFTLTATALVPGDKLDVRVAVAVNDAASGTAVVAAVGAIKLKCDIRG